MPTRAEEVYRDYLTLSRMRDAIRHLRRAKRVKAVAGTEGKVYDFEDSFRSMNERYFNGNHISGHTAESMRLRSLIVRYSST